jgi:hypothetical protein
MKEISHPTSSPPGATVNNRKILQSQKFTSVCASSGGHQCSPDLYSPRYNTVHSYLVSWPERVPNCQLPSALAAYRETARIVSFRVPPMAKSCGGAETAIMATKRSRNPTHCFGRKAVVVVSGVGDDCWPPPKPNVFSFVFVDIAG